MQLGDRWYLTEEEMERFFLSLEALGFGNVPPEEVRRDMQRNGIMPYLPKKFLGNETGYVYEYKFWKISIWTTYVEAINDLNTHDLVWALITDSRNPKEKFFWFRIVRTEHFINRTIDVAEMLVEFVHKWPVCPECGEPLYLTFPDKRIRNLMFFVCGNHTFVHSPLAKKLYVVFDIPISDKNSEILYAGFKRDLEYQYKQSLSGKPYSSDRDRRSKKNYELRRAQSAKDNYYGDIRE